MSVHKFIRDKNKVSLVFNKDAARPFATKEGSIVIPLESKEYLTTSLHYPKTAENKTIRLLKHTSDEVILEISTDKEYAVYQFKRTDKQKFILKTNITRVPWWRDHQCTLRDFMRGPHEHDVTVRPRGIKEDFYRTDNLMIVDFLLIYAWDGVAWIRYSSDSPIQHIEEELNVYRSLQQLINLPKNSIAIDSMNSLVHFSDLMNGYIITLFGDIHH